MVLRHSFSWDLKKLGLFKENGESDSVGAEVAVAAVKVFPGPPAQEELDSSLLKHQPLLPLRDGQTLLSDQPQLPPFVVDELRQLFLLACRA